jgi:hypothetical protein
LTAAAQPSVRDVAEVGEQAVGTSMAALAMPIQRLAEGDARAGLFEGGDAQARPRLGQFDLALQVGEAEAGQAGAAGHPDLVAGLGAVAAQGLARFDFAHGGDAEVERALGGVAADDIDAVFGGAGEEAFGEGGDPGFIDRRQAPASVTQRGCGAHCGEVGEIDGERLPAEVPRVGVGQEMGAGDQHVGGHGQLLAGRRLQQGAVVAGAEDGRGGGPGEVLVDQREFAGIGLLALLAAATSSGRSTAATLSSTPLTYLWPSVPPKALVSSMASLMMTR